MDAPNAIGNNTRDFCSARYKNFAPPEDELWCEPAWDSLLCWPPTKASTTIKQRCPFEDGFDTTKSVEKKCGYNGRWEGQNGTSNEDSPHGWANYTTCLTPEMLRLHGKVYTNTIEGNMKMDIAERTRTLEFVGLSISLVALLASLAIFCRFRSLRNTRTRIHKNLFVAMVVQVLIRLTVYIDIEILRRKTYGIQRGIGNTPVLCEASYALLEYAKTAMFMWMFIEGLFLHNMVTVTVFQETSYYRMYRFVGWGCPVLMTLAWAVVTAFYYHPKSSDRDGGGRDQIQWVDKTVLSRWKHSTAGPTCRVSNDRGKLANPHLDHYQHRRSILLARSYHCLTMEYLWRWTETARSPGNYQDLRRELHRELEEHLETSQEVEASRARFETPSN
ncbi:PDF receptor-like isoform X4 [Hylaeus anthracinus]|uniref:PDF receptor-like isoform X4 n=1 Tax=Hylaeus anthracinus TaxID=313031 RepID=UPI0023B9A1A2|nr:PDF receptor-like isoform X4 [Hylaeus anthracinus]